MAKVEGNHNNYGKNQDKNDYEEAYKDAENEKDGKGKTNDHTKKKNRKKKNKKKSAGGHKGRAAREAWMVDLGRIFYTRNTFDSGESSVGKKLDRVLA